MNRAIKKIDFTPQAEQANKDHIHLVKHCFELYEKFKDSAYRAKKIQEIKDSVEAYEQVEKPTTDPWEGASATVLPLTTISCDNLEPRLVAGLVGRKPYIKFEPENDQKQDPPTEILEAWYNNELEDHVKVEAAAGDIIHQLMQEGTIFPLPSYDLDEQTRRDFVFEEDIQREIQKRAGNNQEALAMLVTQLKEQLAANQQAFIGGVLVGPDGPVTKDVKDTVFEGGKIDLVPFVDVFIPDDVDDWEKAPVIRKVRPTYAELVRDSQTKDGYMNIGPWLCDETDGTELDQDAQTAAQAIDSVKEHGKKVIECIECSISYIYRDDEAEEDEKEVEDFTEERLIAQITCDSKILVRLIPLRELNYKNEHLVKRIRLFPRKGKSYGSSIYAKMRAIQDGASKTFNMAINTAEVTLIPWFFYTEASGIHKNKGKDGKPGVQLKAGKGVKVDDINGLLFPKFAINPDQFINWINLWVSFWERLLSIGDLQVGRQGEKDRTATETMAVIQEGNIKHNYQSQSIKDEFLALLRTIYDLYYQYMPLDKTFLWNGQKVPIPRSLMRRRLKFRLTGSTDQSNKLIERKEKENFYGMTAQDPNINPVKRAEELVKAYGHTDPGEWIIPNIRMIVETIQKTPGAMEAVMQVVQEAEQVAKGIQGGQPQQGRAA